jgi:hypothetical protein
MDEFVRSCSDQHGFDQMLQRFPKVPEDLRLPELYKQRTSCFGRDIRMAESKPA